MEKNTLKFYNTLTRQLEVFQPQSEKEVTLYTCGPTVYNFVHIGNWRTFLFEDFLHRVLQYAGYKLAHVMNITDVGHLTSDEDTGEDKMDVAAKREKKDPYEIAKFYMSAFFRDMQLLHILPADIYPRATDNIPEMIAMIDDLMEKGYAYSTKQGVYFHVPSFVAYGKLSGKKIEDNKSLSREELVDDPEKKHPADFALWKISQPNHLMQWDSPYGRGYPGWHIECSAMSIKYLGQTIDIHTGGEDHVAVHHENEIAQSEGATGKRFVNYWLHGAFLTVDGGRMGKSLGNFYTLEDITKKGINPLALRYLTLQAHYRSKLNFTWEALQQSQQALKNLVTAVANVKMQLSDRPSDKQIVDAYRARFEAAFCDDLNMPQALAVVWEVVKSSDLSPETKQELIVDFDRVLGLDLEKQQEEACRLTPEIQNLVKQREEARKNKDYKNADELRIKLNELGVDILDTPDGPRCQIIS